VGTQIHAGENYRRVVEWIRSGRLGKVSVVRTFNIMNQGPEGLGNAPGGEPPDGLDWNAWVGPAAMRPFHPMCVNDAYTHSSFWNFSGGWTPGMAPHIIDLPIWALDLGVPLVTSCAGGRNTIQDVGDVPDVQEVLWQYPDITMTWMMSMVNSYGFDFRGDGSISRRLGIYFHAVNATLHADYGMYKISPEGDRLKDLEPPKASIAPSPGHEREWLDCIKTRAEPSCGLSYHWRIDLAITLANLSYRLGRSVRFDPAAERIVGDAEAARMARPVYRDPWKFPEGYVDAWA
jgi:predicted dehydrogenase